MEVLGADTTRTTTCPRTPAALTAARALAALTPRGIVRMDPPPQGAGFGGYQQHDPNNPLSIPGYEKLTRSERNLMNALQGVAENPVGSWILDKLGTGWVGKALGVLDVGAENLERFAGFGAQALSAFANPAERGFYEK